MKFSLQSKVRIFVGARNAYLAANGEVDPDPARAIVLSLNEAAKSVAMISAEMQIEFELVPDASGT